jgi:peptidoglycan hydrolase FlgJ
VTAAGGVTNLIRPSDASLNARLRQSAQDLEGVFLSQLFKAMRETVPEGEGIFESSTAEGIFSSMLDEVMGEVTAQRLEGGLGDALYNQLSRRLSGSRNPETASGPSQ